METTVTIKATENVQRLARKAIDIQDACNPLPIAAFLREVCLEFCNGIGQTAGGTDIGIKNPVSQSVLNKLNDLAGLKQSNSLCFSAAMDLAEGTDVEWTYIRGY